MRPQDSSSNRQDQDHFSITTARNRDTSPHLADLRRQIAGAMLSVMPPARPPAPKRPKLSLQTAIPPSPPTQKLGAVLNLSIDSPTTRNTKANAFDAPPPTPQSAVQPRVEFPSSVTASSSTIPSSISSGQSPCENTTPYVLPIGAHSILRNSPLPRRHISATSARPQRRIFPPVKRVAFNEELVQVLPTPIIGETSDSEDSTTLTKEEQQRRRDEIQAEDGHATSTHARRKRRREWVHRPLDDDILTAHGYDRTVHREGPAAIVPVPETSNSEHMTESPASIPLPESAIEKNDSVVGTASLETEAPKHDLETSRT